MNEILKCEVKFEVGKTYSSFVTGEMFECIERTEDTVIFQSETGTKYIPRICVRGDGVEYTSIGTIRLSALFSLV